MNNNDRSPHKPVRFVQMVGSVAISLQDEHFLNGYTHGHHFFQQCSDTMITDWSMYEFLMNIVTVQHSGRWNAGYIVGYMAALFEQPAETVRDVPSSLYAAAGKVIEMDRGGKEQ